MFEEKTVKFYKKGQQERNIMKIKLLTTALLASAAMIVPAQAGGHNGGGGGGNFGGGGRAAARGGGGPSFSAMSGGRFGGGPAFRSMPTRSIAGNRAIYSGQHFSSVGPRVPRSMEFRPNYVNSSANMSIQSRQFTRANINQANRAPRFANERNRVITNPQRAGNRASQMRNGNANLRPDWRNHVFAQHSGNWHRDWNRNANHWWHGHRCHFFNGAWFIFDAGFDPWWPWWYYPYDYYGYGYAYPYSYSYGYDPGYYKSGAYDEDDNPYTDQSADSSVAAVQQRLAREGYYRGQIDGVFGQETRAAIAQFQSNHGLRVTGALTNEMLAALGLRSVASY